MGRRADWMSFLDQRIQVYHLLVIMQEIDDNLSGYVRRQRADGGEACSPEHFRGWCSTTGMKLEPSDTVGNRERRDLEEIQNPLKATKRAGASVERQDNQITGP